LEDSTASEITYLYTIPIVLITLDTIPIALITLDIIHIVVSITLDTIRMVLGWVDSVGEVMVIVGIVTDGTETFGWVTQITQKHLT
jgi:hypothetical protein